MNQIVPPRFLFRWSFPAKKIETIPSSTGRLLDLPEECALPTLGELDQRADFASVKLAWNNGGFALSVFVKGRSGRPRCSIGDLSGSDGVHLWIDTRNMQAVHRATKFCHHFILLPTGGGSKRSSPIVHSLPVARAREETALPKSELVRTQSEVTTTGYWLDAWFPAEVFVGFDPATNSKIGFHYVVHDKELGDQTLAVGSEFPYESDPSLWQTVELLP